MAENESNITNITTADTKGEGMVLDIHIPMSIASFFVVATLIIASFQLRWLNEKKSPKWWVARMRRFVYYICFWAIWSLAMLTLASWTDNTIFPYVLVLDYSMNIFRFIGFIFYIIGTLGFTPIVFFMTFQGMMILGLESNDIIESATDAAGVTMYGMKSLIWEHVLMCAETTAWTLAMRIKCMVPNEHEPAANATVRWTSERIDNDTTTSSTSATHHISLSF